MATVDETVREAILTYPLSSPNRFAVLHQILCVNGNGYRWVNGEAVEFEFGVTTEHWTPESALALRESRYDPDSPPSDFMLAIDAELDEELAQVVAGVDARMHDLTPTGEIYPQTEYAMLLNVPADVTEDWAAVVDWMRGYAAENGWKL